MTQVRIVEVGPRDGLQNERTPIPTAAKLEFIDRLRRAGLREIEATSFVSPKWVPQLADAAELWPQLPPGPLYSALVPNARGLEAAMSVGVQRIALFTAASETFVRRNINMSIAESLSLFAGLAADFRVQGGQWIRGYVSTAFECPYEGKVASAQVLKVCESLLEMGVDELSVGDTIGVAVPGEVRSLSRELLSLAPNEKLAYHFHDTRGTAIANVSSALEMGVRAFDSSAGGLGGCPYAPGAGGNLATDDLVYFLEREGLATGIDPQLLAEASARILEVLDRPPGCKAQQAILGDCGPSGRVSSPGAAS